MVAGQFNSKYRKMTFLNTKTMTIILSAYIRLFERRISYDQEYSFFGWLMWVIFTRFCYLAEDGVPSFTDASTDLQVCSFAAAILNGAHTRSGTTKQQSKKRNGGAICRQLRELLGKGKRN